MIERQAVERLESALSEFPVAALLGPRQVGKTTLALTIADRLGPDGARYLDLESPIDRAKLDDAEAYFEAQEGRLVILDEIQRIPGLFAVLRGIVDQRRRRGDRTAQFLVLGSASDKVLRQTSESLAGRISYIELTPIRFDETAPTTEAVNELWLRGGFPESLLAATDAASMRWRSAFIRTYLERDIPQFSPRTPSETMRRFWTMLAHLHGQQLNAASIASSLGVSGQSVARYLDLLVDLLLVRRLSPWQANVGKRLTRTPKVYLRDSGIVHALLGLPTTEDVLSHPVAGASWEGMVIETLIAAAGDAPCYFYRTSAGGEVDFVVEGPRRSRYCIEIKRSSAPVPSKGFWNGIADIKATESIVVYSGSEVVPLRAGVTARPVYDAAQWLAERVG